MNAITLTVRSDGSFVVQGEDAPHSGMYGLGSGQINRGAPDDFPMCVLGPRGAERAPLERRRLLGLAAKHLYRIMRGG